MIPPNAQASSYGAILKPLLAVMTVIAILFFVSGQWTLGLLDLLLSGIGYLAIRDPMLYNAQQILCVGVVFWCL